MVPFMFLWNDLITLSRMGGHQILLRIWNSLSLLTKSKAFIRSVKVMYRGFLCILHSCCKCLREIMLIIDHSALNPHWDSDISCPQGLAVLGQHEWRAFLWCWARRYHKSCCSHFCCLCLYTVWWCLHLLYPVVLYQTFRTEWRCHADV